MDNQENKNFYIFDGYETQKIYEALNGIDLKICYIPFKDFISVNLSAFIVIISIIYAMVTFFFTQLSIDFRLWAIIYTFLSLIFWPLSSHLFLKLNLRIREKPYSLKYDVEYILNMFSLAQKYTSYHETNPVDVTVNSGCTRYHEWYVYCIRDYHQDNHVSTKVKNWIQEENDACFLNEKEMSIYKQFLDDLKQPTTYGSFKELAKANYKLVIAFFMSINLYNLFIGILFIPPENYTLYLVSLLSLNILFFMFINSGYLDCCFSKQHNCIVQDWYIKRAPSLHVLNYLQEVLNNASVKSVGVSDADITMLRDNNFLYAECSSLCKRKIGRYYGYGA